MNLYSTNSLKTLAISSMVELGLVNLALIEASLHTFNIPALLLTLTTLACGLNKGNKALQTLIVLVKLTLTETSACSENGAVEACFIYNFKIKRTF